MTEAIKNGNSKIKPVVFLHDPDLRNWEYEAVIDGVLATVEDAGALAANGIAVQDIGCGWEFPFTAEHAADIRDESFSPDVPGMLNARALLGYVTLLEMDYMDTMYSVFATTAKLWDGKDPSRPVEGLARRGLGAVISTAFLRTGEISKAEDYIRSLAMHMMGHTFGAAGNGRTYNVALDSRGDKHCADKCIMAPIEVISTDAVKLTNYRKGKARAFCQPCVDDMRNYLGVQK